MKIRAVTQHNLPELYLRDFKDAELLAINYTGCINFSGTEMVPTPLKMARDISDKNRNIVLLHGEVSIDDETFLSVFVFEKGVLKGVSDCITNPAYERGNALRIYRFETLKLGIAVDSDIYHAGIHNLAYQGADLIVSMSKRKFDKVSFAAIRCQKKLSVCPVVFIFGDIAVTFDDTMHTAEQGGLLTTEIKSCVREYRGFLRVTTES